MKQLFFSLLKLFTHLTQVELTFIGSFKIDLSDLKSDWTYLMLTLNEKCQTRVNFR